MIDDNFRLETVFVYLNSEEEWNLVWIGVLLDDCHHRFALGSNSTDHTQHEKILFGLTRCEKMHHVFSSWIVSEHERNCFIGIERGVM
jgi:hypothetical protein